MLWTSTWHLLRSLERYVQALLDSAQALDDMRVDIQASDSPAATRITNILGQLEQAMRDEDVVLICRYMHQLQREALIDTSLLRACTTDDWSGRG